MQIAIVADDLTGAADSAAAFAQSGLTTLVALRDDVDFEADVIAVSTESRDCPSADAVGRVERAIKRLIDRLQGELPHLTYKKMDSALRGHPAAELIATMRALDIDRAILAPALPDERRTTVGGRQHCDGVPLEQSPFGRGLASSDLVATIRSASAEFAVTLVKPAELRERGPSALEPRGIIVADASTDADLDLIAKSALASGYRLMSGSAGLARAIARVGGLSSRVIAPKPAFSSPGPVLIVAGSQHESSIRQIEYAATQGVVVLRPSQSDIDEPAGTIEATVANVEVELTAGRHVIATTAGLRNSPLGSLAVAERLSRIVDSLIVRRKASGLVLTGGDVATAVCARLGATAIWLDGEVRPAIPCGYLKDGMRKGLPIVTKAGSFGPPDTLIACIAHIRSKETRRR